MWVNHKWLWVWAVVVKVEGRRGVWQHVPKMFAGVFCRLPTQNAVHQSAPFLYLLFQCHTTQTSAFSHCEWANLLCLSVKTEGRGETVLSAVVPIHCEACLDFEYCNSAFAVLNSDCFSSATDS